MAAEARFRAMGSDVHLIAVGAPEDAPERARARIDELERRWSRFIDTSEVSRMNASAGKPVVVSDDTFDLVSRAVEAWRTTKGRFDPTVLGALLAAGYDRTFEELGDATGAPDARGLRTGCDGIVLEPAVPAVTLPPGVGFDPGGIGKGFAADIVVAEMMSDGCAGACVNLGGDLRVAGESPAGGEWSVEISHPFDARPACVVGVADGAVATTTRTRRTWERDGRRAHHLIDPATGTPAYAGLAQVTIVASEGWWAEVWAKAAFVAGARAAADVLSHAGVVAFLVDDDGVVTTVEGDEAA